MLSMAPDRHPSPHAAAKLVTAFALGCGVALTVSGGGSPKAPASVASTATPAPPHRARASDQFAHTRAGAAAAATAWCQTTTEAFVHGGWDGAVDALTIGAFRALALRYEPAAALVHRRLVAAHTPYALRLWPLGYLVQQYSSTLARVRVWQLYVLAIASPAAHTEFATTTVSLRWADGTWKVTGAPSGADLTPPREHAAPRQVATWVSAVERFRGYEYVP